MGQKLPRISHLKTYRKSMYDHGSNALLDDIGHYTQHGCNALVTTGGANGTVAVNRSRAASFPVDMRRMNGLLNLSYKIQ